MVTIAVSLCPSSFLCLTLDVVVGVHLKTSGAFLTETKTCSSLKKQQQQRHSDLCKVDSSSYRVQTSMPAPKHTEIVHS